MPDSRTSRTMNRISTDLKGWPGIIFLDDVLVAFSNLDDPVSGDIRERLNNSGARPAHSQLVHHLVLIQSKMQPQRALRTVAVSQDHLARLLSAAYVNGHSSTHGVAVGCRPYQFDL